MRGFGEGRHGRSLVSALFQRLVVAGFCQKVCCSVEPPFPKFSGVQLFSPNPHILAQLPKPANPPGLPDYGPECPPRLISSETGLEPVTATQLRVSFHGDASRCSAWLLVPGALALGFRVWVFAWSVGLRVLSGIRE